MQAGGAIQVFRLQGGARAHNDVAHVLANQRDCAQLMDMLCRNVLSQNDQAKAFGQARLEQALNPTINVQDLLYERDGAVGPAEDDNVAADGDWRESLFKLNHHCNQPACHDRHQRAERKTT